MDMIELYVSVVSSRMREPVAARCGFDNDAMVT
jgi:hypothetical protein